MVRPPPDPSSPERLAPAPPLPPRASPRPTRPYFVHLLLRMLLLAPRFTSTGFGKTRKCCLGGALDSTFRAALHRPHLSLHPHQMVRTPPVKILPCCAFLPDSYSSAPSPSLHLMSPQPSPRALVLPTGSRNRYAGTLAAGRSIRGSGGELSAERLESWLSPERAWCFAPRTLSPSGTSNQSQNEAKMTLTQSHMMQADD